MPEKDLLKRLHIATPCNVKWEEMSGDDRVRTCAACTKHVYNISDMSTKDAEQFLQTHGTSVCMQFYRRSDGTIITDNCPIGLRKVRNSCRIAFNATAAYVSIIVSITGSLAKSGTQAACKLKTIEATKTKEDTADITATSRSNYFKRFPVAGQPFPFAPDDPGLPSFQQLTEGKYALLEDEIYQRNGSIYLRIPDLANSAAKDQLTNAAGVDLLDPKLTVSECFKRAQLNEAKKRTKLTDFYYRLTLKYFDCYEGLEPLMKDRVVARYSLFLQQCGRLEDAQAMERGHNFWWRP